MIPEWAWVHRSTVEPYLGRTGVGVAYGPPVEHQCVVFNTKRLVRGADGREVTARTGVIYRPGTEIPPESRITVSGRQLTAVEVAIRDGGGLATPDHVQVMCE